MKNLDKNKQFKKEVGQIMKALKHDLKELDKAEKKAMRGGFSMDIFGLFAGLGVEAMKLINNIFPKK
jgi:hypothetical protein